MAENNDALHPLEWKWTIWYDLRKTQSDGQSWEDSLQKVADFDTVEDFWSTYNHIKRPNALSYGANYHVFKDGIKPMWEDPANRKGGRFVIVISNFKEDARLNDIWEHLLLAMIGEYIEEGVASIPGGHVTGAVLGRRKNATKISIWTRDRGQVDALEELKDKLKTLLQLRADVKITYEPHTTI